MFVLIPRIQIENLIFPFKIMGKRVHVDILFTATTITVLSQILFQTGGQIGIKAMPGIFSPPGFFLNFLFRCLYTWYDLQILHMDTKLQKQSSF